MAEKTPPKKINVRLDEDASALLREAKEKSRRSLNKEASTALISYYEKSDKKLSDQP